MYSLYYFTINFFHLIFDKRKKVLLTFYDLGLGGIQTKIIDLANALSEDEKNCVIVYLHKRSSFERDYLLNEKVKVLYNPTFFSNLVKNRYYYLLLAIFVFIKPNRVFISLEKASLFSIYWARKFNLKTKIIANIDTNYMFEQKVDDAFVNSLLNKADAVIAVSKATYTDLKDRVGIKSPPLKYLPNWTSVREVASKKNSNDIVFLGRFEQQKRPLFVLEFALLAKRNRINTHIYMYGSGSLQTEMERFIRSHSLKSYVTILPPTHNAIEVLEKSKYMIVTSLYEGLSFAMLEAMSVGTPILALKAPGVSELVHDGKTGVLKSDIGSLFKEFMKLQTLKNNSKYSLLQQSSQKMQQNKYGFNAMMKVVNEIDPQLK
jgi:glycosyltransferase involved in cell wall biosynthesis